ncbi:MAG: dTDP-4-dehydrorhamnose reductase [Lachnospiraceae bacterium]|nr:dTDP-4-dehydrorhamnose reductase [Lachnospiraceae bacterium]
MKKVFITGANGQLGRAIQKEYGNTVEYVLSDMLDMEGILKLDISDLDAVRAAVNDTNPDVIINCAAYTNVDGCEKNEDLAYQANAIGPKNLAIAAKEKGIKLVHVSTDYVFNGNGTRPYVETDEPDPVSAYGRTKRAGEDFVKENCDKYFILRTAWLYGDGKNFVKTMLSLAETHDELSVVCDQLGTPTSAAELAKMIHFLEGTEEYGIYHATCEGDTNWADFTEEIFKKTGKNVKVNHVTSEEYKKMNPASADRPHYSILENAHLKSVTKDFSMADWHDALDDYLKNL